MSIWVWFYMLVIATACCTLFWPAIEYWLDQIVNPWGGHND